MGKIRYILLAAIFLFAYLLLSNLLPYLIDISSPFLRPISRVSRLVVVWFSFPSIYKEYQELKEKQLDIQFYEHYISTLRKENKELRTLLDMPEERGFKKIFADVLVEPTGHPDFFYINAGKDKGIKPGCGVILPGYVVCGRILEVYPHSSKVAYPWNINFSVSAIDESTREEGVVVGGAGSSLRFRFLDADSILEKGDVLRTSTLSSFFPPGCLIGEVTRFDCDINHGECSAEVSACIKGMVFYRVIVLLPKQAGTK